MHCYIFVTLTVNGDFADVEVLEVYAPNEDVPTQDPAALLMLLRTSLDNIISLGVSLLNRDLKKAADIISVERGIIAASLSTTGKWVTKARDTDDESDEGTALILYYIVINIFIR